MASSSRPLIACAILAAACWLGGCTQPDDMQPVTHVDRVIDDVSAMVEGMARAHAAPAAEMDAPGLRSLAPSEQLRP